LIHRQDAGIAKKNRYISIPGVPGDSVAPNHFVTPARPEAEAGLFQDDLGMALFDGVGRLGDDFEEMGSGDAACPVGAALVSVEAV